MSRRLFCDKRYPIRVLIEVVVLVEKKKERIYDTHAATTTELCADTAGIRYEFDLIISYRLPVRRR